MKRLLFFLLLLIAASSFAQDTAAYAKHLFIKGKDTLPFRILYPLNYDAKKQYPLVLFLHGAGERGNNNALQLVHGAKLFADSANRMRYPAIVVFPQCPITDFWANIKLLKPRTDSIPNQFEYASAGEPRSSLLMVTQLMDSLARLKTVNNKRIYIGGLSMGGMGTFELLWRKPGFFAAAFPICGGGAESTAAIYGKDFPIWIFHGAKDPVVDVNDSRKMTAALKQAGADVRYSEYPAVGHDSWTNAFAEPELLAWLFGQQKQ
ncbi:MAG TPA: dienelactone hydrolase family protein [Chitinophagaceae bacterium]|nr:dienelactone hydrolase family protein [Chitinophagaceae bacterium]